MIDSHLNKTKEQKVENNVLKMYSNNLSLSSSLQILHTLYFLHDLKQYMASTKRPDTNVCFIVVYL